jgi:hypothetical protein
VFGFWANLLDPVKCQELTPTASFMKLFNIEIIKSLGERRLELGGRNCRDAVVVGDELSVETRPSTKVRITEIEVYHRLVDKLHHGYVGTLSVVIITGDDPCTNENLVAP